MRLTEERPRATRKTIASLLLVLGVFAIALFLRTYRLDSLPPGLYRDEAFNGLDILDVLQGKFSLFFARNGGREPLFIYCQAVSVFLFGNTALALRVVSVFFGSLTTLATFVLARKWFGYRVGLLSMAGIAIAFWHVDLSRVGLRAISTPFFLVLALYFLWNSLHGGKRWHSAVAGLLVGLCLYTYTSARMAIPLFFGIIVVEWLVDRQAISRQRQKLLVFVAVAVLVMAPLGAYFVANPQSFTARIEQVSAVNQDSSSGSGIVAIWHNLRQEAKMFFIEGDSNWRHNLSGRPVFGPVSGTFFGLGLALALIGLFWKKVRPSTGEQESSSPRFTGALPLAWLLLWSALALIPDLLADASPHFLRLTALAPAAFILAALGYDSVWRAVSNLKIRWAGYAFGLFLVVLLAWEGVSTFQDYFFTWAQNSGVYWGFDTNMAEAAATINAARDTMTDAPSIVVCAETSPTLEFLVSRRNQTVEFHKDTNPIALPDNLKAGAFYVQPGSVPAGPLLSKYPEASKYRCAQTTDGSPAYCIYLLPGDKLSELVEPQQRVNVLFGDELELVGVSSNVDLSQPVAPGQTVDIRLVWRLVKDRSSVYHFFVHFADEQGKPVYQRDVSSIDIGGWKEGGLLVSTHQIQIPADAQTMSLRVQTGVAFETSGKRLTPATGDPNGSIKLYSLNIVRPK